MSFSYVQSTSNTSGTSATFPSPVTAGNLLIVHLGTSTAPVATATDSMGNSYYRLSAAGGSGGFSMLAAMNVGSGSNVVTISGLGGGRSLAIVEYAMPPLYNLFPTMVFSGGAGGSLPDMVVGSPALIIAGIYDFHTAHSWTGTNLTIRETTSEPGGQCFGCADGNFTSITTSTTASITGGSGNCTSGWLAVYVSGGLLYVPKMNGGFNG